jgi:hypothetical protein
LRLCPLTGSSRRLSRAQTLCSSHRSKREDQLRCCVPRTSYCWDWCRCGSRASAIERRRCRQS